MQNCAFFQLVHTLCKRERKDRGKTEERDWEEAFSVMMGTNCVLVVLQVVAKGQDWGPHSGRGIVQGAAVGNDALPRRGGFVHTGQVG